MGTDYRGLACQAKPSGLYPTNSEQCLSKEERSSFNISNCNKKAPQMGDSISVLPRDRNRTSTEISSLLSLFQSDYQNHDVTPSSLVSGWGLGGGGWEGGD